MPNFIHEKAICESNEIGADTRVWAFAHVLPGAKIGARCNIGENVFIENDVTIGDGSTIKNGVAIWDGVCLEADVFIGPNAVFTNDLRPRAFIKTGNRFFKPTRVKRGASVGANATLVCGITVGEYAMVGAGSVVVRDVAPHTLVVGNPAREVGRVCFCGQALDEADFCVSCGLPVAENSAQNAAVLRTGGSAS